MGISKNDIIQRVQQASLEADWSISEQGNRVIVSNSHFRCFIGKAFNMATRKSTVSAHMVLYNDSELFRLQFWEPSSRDNDEQVLERIFKELHNVELYYKYHN
jgi:hypothetical protein